LEVVDGVVDGYPGGSLKGFRDEDFLLLPVDRTDEMALNVEAARLGEGRAIAAALHLDQRQPFGVAPEARLAATSQADVAGNGEAQAAAVDPGTLRLAWERDPSDPLGSVLARDGVAGGASGDGRAGTLRGLWDGDFQLLPAAGQDEEAVNRDAVGAGMMRAGEAAPRHTRWRQAMEVAWSAAAERARVAAAAGEQLQGLDQEGTYVAIAPLDGRGSGAPVQRDGGVEAAGTALSLAEQTDGGSEVAEAERALAAAERGAGWTRMEERQATRYYIRRPREFMLSWLRSAPDLREGEAGTSGERPLDGEGGLGARPAAVESLAGANSRLWDLRDADVVGQAEDGDAPRPEEAWDLWDERAAWRVTPAMREMAFDDA
jgi:hypothetical protein